MAGDNRINPRENRLPHLGVCEGQTTLFADGEPFVILGGELHNSSASDLTYMDRHVWPGLRRLGGNCYLLPVYWECLEPEQGNYDFSLVDGLIAQAERESVKLVFLWFGLWKNGNSAYTPAWIKRDPSFFYMEKRNGTYLESVSPFCEKGIEADAAAFTALMAHLKDTDLKRTVIMIQTENEIGTWGSPRDYGEAAERAYSAPVPEEIVSIWPESKDKSWEEAFGLKGPEYFMAWAFSSAIGRIAAAGKAVYPIPQFMNCVPDMLPIPGLAGVYPSGGPEPSVQRIFRKMAPDIDLYGPDIYSPVIKGVTEAFSEANGTEADGSINMERRGSLMIPETGQGKDCISKVLYSVTKNLICFSPFGIDGMMTPLLETDYLAQMNAPFAPEQQEGAENLRRAYQLLRIMMPEIRRARSEGRIHGFFQEGMGDLFTLPDANITVSYSGMELGEDLFMPGMGAGGKQKDGAPCGGGFILQLEDGSYLLAGVSANITIAPRYAQKEQVFVLRKREYFLDEEGIHAGRILSGDEGNHIVLGSSLTIQSIEFYRR